MQRLRSYRTDQKTRDLFSEVVVSKSDLIQPYFVVEGENIKNEIPSLIGVYHFSVDKLAEEIKELIDSGINKILLFGVIEDRLKDYLGSNSYTKDNVVVRAIKVLKERYPQLIIFADVCLCGYTDHGHCGVLTGDAVDNDETIKLLAKISLNYANAGVDFVAPSAMMDWQVKAIKEAFLTNNLFETKILSYSVKFASNFYGPFRDAVSSTPKFGDRKSYQADFTAPNIAIKKAEVEIEEGADIIMVKPASNYLDVIYRLKIDFWKCHYLHTMYLVSIWL